MKTPLIFIFSSIFFAGFGQLKVDNSGRVGIGTPFPNPGYQLHVIKSTLISNPANTSFYQLVSDVSGTGNPTIWSSSNVINFFGAPNSLWNDLCARNYFKISDSTLKSEIMPIKYGLEELMRMKPVQYSMLDTKQISEKEISEQQRREFGFVSQEIKNLFPTVDITREENGHILMDYDQVIPLLVKSVQQQQVIIQSMQEELDRLAKLTSTPNFESQSPATNLKNQLFQNVPNPFSEATTIRYSLDAGTFSSGSIIVFNLNGALLKSYKINTSGEGSVVINASELAPGKYYYSLVLNNEEIATKSLIILGN